MSTLHLTHLGRIAHYGPGPVWEISPELRVTPTCGWLLVLAIPAFTREQHQIQPRPSRRRLALQHVKWLEQRRSLAWPKHAIKPGKMRGMAKARLKLERIKPGSTITSRPGRYDALGLAGAELCRAGWEVLLLGRRLVVSGRDVRFADGGELFDPVAEFVAWTPAAPEELIAPR